MPGTRLNRKIVVIEDAPTTQVAIRRTLELGGFDVTVYSNGKAGLRSILDDPPDAVVIDIGVPGLDGLTVLRTMRRDRRAAHVPAVVVTANADGGIQGEVLRLGATIVAKPFDPAELQRMVDRAAASKVTRSTT